MILIVLGLIAAAVWACVGQLMHMTRILVMTGAATVTYREQLLEELRQIRKPLQNPHDAATLIDGAISIMHSRNGAS